MTNGRAMGTRVYEVEQVVAAPIESVFSFFADAYNLQAITPPWLDFRVLTPAPIAMGVGTLIDYRLRLRGMPIRWRTRIAAWEPPTPGSDGRVRARFVDEQLKGPYRLWRHEHTFESIEPGLGKAGSIELPPTHEASAHPGTTRCTDRVEYLVPGGPLEPLIHRAIVRGDLERIFEFRRARIADLLSVTPAEA